MNSLAWERFDSLARQTKRRVFAGTRRSIKIARRRTRDAAVQSTGLLKRVARRLRNLRKPLVRWRHRVRRVHEQWGTYREEWCVEREIERVVSGASPIIVGPWLSEVGYEVLYWVPFVRWVKAAFRIDPERLFVISRGGVGSWYADITPQYTDIFDEIGLAEFSVRNMERSDREGTNKQFGRSDLDSMLVDRIRMRRGLGDVNILHPSLMYRLFKSFWSGHRPLDFLDSHTRHTRLVAPAFDLRALALPDEYVAIKFYAARSLPDTVANRALLRTLVEAIAERWPVVLLDTGLDIDDHADYRFRQGGRIVTTRAHLDARTNLGVQTQIIAGARAFVGTCGSLAWLAPMLGVDSTAVFTDARFLHSHLHAARRLFHVLDGGRFSPLDLSALDSLGLTLTSRQVVSGRAQPLS